MQLFRACLFAVKIRYSNDVGVSGEFGKQFRLRTEDGDGTRVQLMSDCQATPGMPMSVVVHKITDRPTGKCGVVRKNVL